MDNAPTPSESSPSSPVRVQNLSRQSGEVRAIPAAPIAPLVPVVQVLAGPRIPQPVSVEGAAKPSALQSMVSAWKKIGGGSLMLSVLIHAGLLIAAVFVVQTIVHPPAKVDFLPGESSAAGEKASNELNQKMKSATQRRLSQATPLQRITVAGPATIALDDAQLDPIDIQGSADSLLGGGKMGAGAMGGGLGASGLNGAGSTKLSGFLATTFFGKLGGDGLPGTFYDLKQDQERKPLTYDQNQYPQIVKNAADKKFSPEAMKGYYRAAQQMSFTFLAIPYMRAEEGPKAFNVDKEVQPRGWFVHYTGYIVAPKAGEWRFVGNFDDALLVYINNKPVLDASWAVIGNLGEKAPDLEIRQSFGGPPVLTPNARAYAGKWVRLDGPAKIDIIVGERPGGYVGGMLLVQHRKGKYKERPDGSPILPVFTTVKPEVGDMDRMQQFVDKPPTFELEMNDIPVFQVKNSKAEFDTRTSLLPPR